MAATTISRSTWTDGSSGTLIDNAALGTDVYDPIDALFTSAFTFGDLVHSEGIGTHSWSAGGAGGNIFNLRNTTAGASNFAGLHLGQDGDADLGRVEAYSSSYTETGAIKQSGVGVRSMGAGGLSLAAEAGDVRIYGNGTTKLATFDGDRHTFSGGTPGTYVAGGVLTSSVDTSDAANTGTSETDLHSYSLPGGTLGTDGQAIRITAGFTTAANANNKRFRVYFGSTVIYDSTNWAANDEHGMIICVVARTGAATQRAFGRGFRNSSGSPIDVYATPGETLANPVTIKTTGQSGTTSNDITARLFMVELIH